MIRFVEVINRTEKNPRMERTAKLAYDLGEVWINEKYQKITTRLNFLY